MGDLYRVKATDEENWSNDWLNSPYPEYKAANPTSMHGGNWLVHASLVYTEAPVIGWGQYRDDHHYIIEGSVPISAFSEFWGKSFTVHWTMDCGNDAIMVDPPSPAPEPATIALIGLGLAGIRFSLRRRAT